MDKMNSELTKNSIIYVCQLLNNLLDDYDINKEFSASINDNLYTTLLSIAAKLKKYDNFDPNQSGAYPTVNPKE